MRTIDPRGMQIVHHGKTWDLDGDPCSREMYPHLERNEAIVTWLQPQGGSVTDQIPCIVTKRNEFCALSLRMQKAIFRHTRLCRNFVNREPLSQGGYKLRIPTLLLAVITSPCFYWR